MELRERNYRSKLGSKRSTKARREAEADDDQDRPLTDREKFSITRNHERQEIDFGHQIKKWAPLVILGAVIWYLVQTYAF